MKTIKTIAVDELALVSGGSLSTPPGMTIFNPNGPRPDVLRPSGPSQPLPNPMPELPGKLPPGYLDLPRRNDLA